VDDDRIECPRIGVDQHPRKLGTPGDLVSASRAAFVSINLNNFPPMAMTVLPTGVLLGVK
jgi:hypothetical protein